jgi:sugar phosphate isomerase/epimerase
MQISYSTMGFGDRDLGDALQAIASAGFTEAEISRQPPHASCPLRGDDLERFRVLLRECGVNAGTVHAPMRENVLGAPEGGWRRDKVGVLTDCIRFAADIGAEGLVVHPVPNPIFVSDHERPELTQVMAEATRRSLDELVPVAQENGVRMLLENLPYDCHYPFLGMGELRPLVEFYPEEALGLVIDTGHAWTSGNDPAEEIRIAGSRLWGTHLQDVDADSPQDNHWVPTHGGLNWASIRDALSSVDYAGSWTFEVIVPRHGEGPDELARLTRQVASAWAPGPGTEQNLHP